MNLPTLEEMADWGLRLARIESWHSRETAPAGMVGDWCNECDRRWPCDTWRMANGTYQDDDPAP